MKRTIKKLIIGLLSVVILLQCSACEKSNSSKSEEKTTATTTQAECERHTWGTWAEITPATCAKTGEKQRVCKVCGEIDSRQVEKTTVHDWYDPGKCKVCSVHMPEEYRFYLNADEASYAFNYDGNETHVVIPDTYNGMPVTKLADCAFYWTSDLKSVKIPDTVTEIGDEAFALCQRLTTVRLPSGVTKIGKQAFYGCTSLQSLAIPNGVTRIEDWAFADAGITSLNLHKNITFIGESAFQGCVNIKTVTIPASVTEIGASAFSACRELQTVTFAKGSPVTVIPYGAFGGNPSLKTIMLPEGLITIEDEAFSGNNYYDIITITIPITVKSIGENAFWGKKISEFIYNGTSEEWFKIEIAPTWINTTSYKVTCKDFTLPYGGSPE